MIKLRNPLRWVAMESARRAHPWRKPMAKVTLDAIRQPVGDGGLEMGSVDLGSMSVLSHRWPTGFDARDMLTAAFGPLCCPVPHHFIVTKGVIEVAYTMDGEKEQAKAGDVVYARPGHSVRAIEAADVIEISPIDGTAYIGQRLAALG